MTDKLGFVMVDPQPDFDGAAYLQSKSLRRPVKAKKPRHDWKPLYRTQNFAPLADDLIEKAMESYSLDREAAIALLKADRDSNEWWRNDKYQVMVRCVKADEGFYQLNIRRVDGGPILRDWREFQQIKNELLGPECEAVELYPAESRKVDEANKFHLWGWRNPHVRIPFGFTERKVSYESDQRGSAGLRQRPE